MLRRLPLNDLQALVIGAENPLAIGSLTGLVAQRAFLGFGNMAEQNECHRFGALDGIRHFDLHGCVVDTPIMERAAAANNRGGPSLLRPPVADDAETAGAVSHSRAGFSFDRSAIVGRVKGQAATAGAGQSFRAGRSFLLSSCNVRASCNGTNTATGSKHMSRYEKDQFFNLSEHIAAAYPRHAAKHLSRELGAALPTAKRYAAGAVPQRLAARLAARLLPVIARREAHLRRLRLDLEKALHGGESAEISRRGALGAGDRRRARGAPGVARGLSGVPADRADGSNVRKCIEKEKQT